MLARETILAPELEELFEEDRWARDYAAGLLRKSK